MARIRIRLKLTTIVVAVPLFILYLLGAGGLVVAIARGYLTNDIGLQVGMVVSLSNQSEEGSFVERATQDNQTKSLGVVTTSDDALITVASKNTSVLVETEGEVEAYISDLGGPVKKGDLLAISPIKGVLMKADHSSLVIFAIATSDFETGSSQEYFFQNSEIGSARIGRLKINLIRKAGLNTQGQGSTLAKLGRAVVGKDVNEIRVVIAMIIFFIVLVAGGGILYGAISSAISSLGRNPLAGKIIRKELIRVFFVSGIVFGVGLVSIYGILWI